MHFWMRVKRPLSTAFAALLLLSVCANVLVKAGEERRVFSDSIKPISTNAVVANRAAPDTTSTLDFMVALTMRDRAGLQARIDSGEIISPDEMKQKYCPLESDYQAQVDWLKAQGFTINYADPSRLGVFVTGTVAQIQTAFQCDFAPVNGTDGKTYLSASSAPSMPAALAGPVLGINGLQPHIRPHVHSHRKAIAAGGIAPRAGGNNSPPFYPSEILKAYNANGLTVNGAGQKIAILIDTFPLSSDLTTFWNNTSVPQTIGNVEFINVRNVSLPTPTGEETLDAEWSSGIASGAGLRIYAAGDLGTTHLNQAIATIIADLPSQPGMRQLSISLGLGEYFFTSAQLNSDANQYAMLAAGGVSVFISSGDAGSIPDQTGDTGGPIQPESSASDVNVTAVGGTSLFLNGGSGTVSNETVWVGSGGGVSLQFARPNWQKGGNFPAGTTRLVPDVAAAANPSTGCYVILNNGVVQYGGTSWSAPMWAGFCALINQARANAGQSSAGLLGPKIYPLLGTTCFRDITSGNNGSANAYSAKPGFDLCTGLGVPHVANLITALTQAPTAALTVSSTTVTGATGTANAIDVNECNSMNIVVVNYGSVSATGITATLISNTAGVTIAKPFSAYPDIAASGGTGTNSTAFSISTSSSFVAGTTISLSLQVKAAGNLSFNLPLQRLSATSPGTAVRFDNNTMQAIPDLGAINSPITVSGISTPISKVTCSLYITHSNDNDLTLQLISPDGTVVTLANELGGSGNNFGSGTADTSRTTFNDSASTAITSGSAPFASTNGYRPQMVLSAYIGKSDSAVNGAWQLRCTDAGYTSGGGTLQAWSLFITPTVSVDGGGVCPLPAVIADSYRTNTNTALTVPAGLGVLSNDKSDGAAALTATLVSTTASGTLSLSSNGSFTYTPNTNFTGTDSFTYYATGTNSSLGTATITVGGSNYTWNGGAGTFAAGTGGWDVGNWADNNTAIFGKGTDSAGTVTISSTVRPSNLIFNPTLSGAYAISGGTIDFNAGGELITTSASAAISSVLVNGSLMKAGSQTLSLSAANTYAGTTTIGAGTLMVNGSLASGGAAVFVSSGGTLRGTGVVNRGVNVASGGIVWPGVAAEGAAALNSEILTVTSLDFSTGGKLNIAANGTNAEKLIVNGGTTCNLSGAILALGITSGTFVNQKYTVLDAGNGTANIITAPFASFSTGGVTQAAVTVQYLNFAGSTVAPSASTPANRVQITINGAVTPVTLEAFAARTDGAGVLLSWNAVSEYRNLGFNLFRREVSVAGSAWAKINPALIPGRISSPDLKSYRHFDWPLPGNYEYRLESVNVDGGRKFFGEFAGSVMLDNLTPGTDQLSNASIAAAEETLRIDRSAARAGQLTDAAIDAVPHAKIAAVTARSEAAPPESASTLTARSILPRWFSPTVSSGGGAGRCVKVACTGNGALWIPAAAFPQNFDFLRARIQREGRSIRALNASADGVLLYAPGYEDDYTDRDAFFFTASNTPILTSVVPQVHGLYEQPAESVTAATATAQFHDVYYDYSLRPFNFPPWFSSQYLTENQTAEFALETPGVNSAESAAITVNLWALTDVPTARPDHGIRAFINGELAGEATWQGGGKMLELAFQIPPDVLVSGANKIELAAPVLDGVTQQISFIHSLSISYSKKLEGQNSFVILNAGTTPRIFEIAGLQTDAAWVVDARFPERAALVPSESQRRSDGSFTIRFSAPPGGNGTFLVVPKGHELAPLTVKNCILAPLPKGIRYLATGPAQFASALQPLLLAHAKDGLRAAFADQQQLFDYYGFGRYGPAGIRNAIRSTRPAYVLLAGRTSYDYKNYSGANVDPLCPAFLISSNNWAQTTSDALFADLGRGYPEAAIGRLPANDASEMAETVRHVLANPGMPASAWRGHLVADRDDPAVGSFASFSDIIAASAPDVSWTRNYLGTTTESVTDVRSALARAANGEADVIVFEGHGNSVRLGKLDPRIVDTLAPDSIQSWQGSSVFIQNGCVANWMANPVTGWRSIAMLGLSQPGGGIAMSIGSTTYTQPQPSVDFTQRLLREAAVPGSRWGDALLRTQRWAWTRGGDSAQEGADAYRDLLRTECILGDPAMLIEKKNAVPATSGGISQPGTF